MQRMLVIESLKPVLYHPAVAMLSASVHLEFATRGGIFIMATNRTLEIILRAQYPNSMKHLQQLIMDSEAAAKAYGKKSLFGNDKFEPAFDAFMSTIGRCVVSLSIDGHFNDRDDAEAGVDALNEAMLRCEEVYGNWPMGFRFWRDYYRQFKAKIEREQ